MDQPSPRAVTFEILAYPDPFVVRLVGEIDLSNSAEVAALAAHPANGSGTVVFDLADVSFIGSSAIDAFILVAQSARKFTCRNVSAIVDRVLRVMGLEWWLEDSN